MPGLAGQNILGAFTQLMGDILSYRWPIESDAGTTLVESFCLCLL